MISAIGNRWAIRGPHQSLLLSLLAFRYSAIRFNMLSSFFFYCMFPPPLHFFLKNVFCVDYSADKSSASDDPDRTFKIWMQTLKYPHSFFTLRFLNLNHSHKKTTAPVDFLVEFFFFFGSPFNSTFGLAALSGSMLIHAFVSACLFKSVRWICSGWLPSISYSSRVKCPPEQTALAIRWPPSRRCRDWDTSLEASAAVTFLRKASSK